MKAKISILLWAGLASLCFAGADDLALFSNSANHIIVGTVYYVSEYSFGISTDWELKGQLGLSGCDVAFSNRGEGTQVKVGDKIMVFINRERAPALSKFPERLGLKQSRYDEFLGQSAYRPIQSAEDYTFISSVYDAVNDKQMASAFTF